MQAATTFQAGEVVSKHEKDLVSEGLITADQLAIAKISKENLGIDLASVLIRKGFATEEELLEFIAKRMGIPFVTLKDFQLDQDLVYKVPQHIARQHGVLPIGKKDGKVMAAMTNPFDSFARDDLRDMVKMEIEPHLVSAREIEEVLDRLYNDNHLTDDKGLTLEVSSEAAENPTETRKMQEMALGPKIVAAVNNIIARASYEGASDIHIEPSRQQVGIRYRIDGMLRERGVHPKSMHGSIVSRIKILAGLDIAERRVPQDGRVRVILVGKPLDLRVSTCPTQHGEKIVIRLLSKDGVRSIEALGFSERERRIFSDIITKSNGIFLATGPTGSGKSTTLYAALARINSSEKNIISIEDPVESEVAGITQVEVNSKTGLTFAAVLRSVLRQDPDVIMLGEIRDAETAQIAVRAAITGHMVLSTLHTNSAAGAISRLMDLGVESFMLASALKGVMAQRLVRRICQHCREEVPVDAAKARLLSVQPKKNFAGRGCKACHFTGYSGRAGIFELAMINETVREQIHNDASELKVVEAFRAMGVKSIVQDGVDKVEGGITTVEEILRVTSED